MQHTKITRNLICYDNSIKSLEWLIKHGEIAELTTPIFNFWNVTNVILTVRKYKVAVRLAKLIDTPLIKSPSQKDQLRIAKIMRLIYNRVYLTCSLYGQCKRLCDYPKSTILATGKIMGCAINKLSKTEI